MEFAENRGNRDGKTQEAPHLHRHTQQKQSCGWPPATSSTGMVRFVHAQRPHGIRPLRHKRPIADQRHAISGFGVGLAPGASESSHKPGFRVRAGSILVAAVVETERPGKCLLRGSLRYEALATSERTMTPATGS